MADGGTGTTTTTEKVETNAGTGTSTTTETLLAKPDSTTTTTTTEKTPTSAFGEKWREELATGDDGKVDEKWLKQLQRYKSPRDYDQAHRQSVAKILEGQKHEPLPDKPTPEQLTAWRAQNGIPEKHDGYEIKLPEGLEIAEADKPRLDGFLKRLHSVNATPAVVNAAAAWYYEEQEAALDARTDADKAAKSEAEEALREIWGPDFKTNLNVIGGMIDTMPEDVRDLFRFARLKDGTPMGANAGVMNTLADWARQLNPIGTVVPIGSGDAGATAQKELDEIKALMGDTRSKYWVGADSARLQERFGVLSKALAAGKK